MTFKDFKQLYAGVISFLHFEKTQNLVLTDEKNMPYSLFPRQIKKTDEREFIQIGRKNCDNWRQCDFVLSPVKNLLNRVRR